ncbi:NAD-dependent epimerase/dehydratase family protein [Frondihabitans australicus]|uniref:Nucleoside-diphosphate-sugar epimerase n=1 Tax=Frondihabitans australicus TaxID=386892 RepID=A0A495IDB4_9MICO|nr:NAD-dependent epimerase/dehydratase family protein [Frondihabitans australicus]RKR73952.1 nucleoside-diphosphate-sugar epimerase [Frondihabitans australicus]
MRALVLGVNGVTGRGLAPTFLDSGWDVVATGRGPSRLTGAWADAVDYRVSDRTDERALRHLLDEVQPDVVVDCVCYTAAHARALVDSSGAFGSAVVLSSKAVYVDPEGHHSNSDEPPAFARPVTEGNAVLEPDWSGDYASRGGYGTNKVAAEIVLRESGLPVSILRPSRIHGPGASPSREWFVVRRLLDGRGRIPLSQGGATGNHPTSAAALAGLALACALSPAPRTLNVADAGTPTAGAVVRAIAEAMGTAVEVVGLPATASAGDRSLGYSPWATWPPFFLDTAEATRTLGWRAPTYAATVGAAVDELLSLSPDEQAALSVSDYFTGLFDYSVDDAALALVDS